jgi:hypothetical protein
MQQKSQHDYAAIARTRWPRVSTITGSGHFAVRFLQDGRTIVRLFENGNEGIVFSHANRGDYFDLKWYVQNRPVKFVRKPHWLRDIESA